MEQQQEVKAYPIGNLENFQRERHIFDLQFSRGKGRLSVVTPNIYRMQHTTGSHWGYKPYLAIEEKEWKSVPIQIRRHAEKLDITTPRLLISLVFKPFNIRIYDHDGHLITQDHQRHAVVYQGSRIGVYKKSPPGSIFLGLGDLPGPLDRSGRLHRLEMLRNADKRLRQQHNTEIVLPLFCHTGKGKTIGFFLDNPSCSLVDLRHTARGDFSMATADGELDYYCIVGDSVDEVVQGFFTLLGTSALPPRWSLEIIKGLESRLSAKEFLARFNPVRDNFLETSSIVVHPPAGTAALLWDESPLAMLKGFRRTDRIPHFMAELDQRLPAERLQGNGHAELLGRHGILEAEGQDGRPQLDGEGNAFIDPFSDAGRAFVRDHLKPTVEAGLQGVEVQDGCPPWSRKDLRGAVVRCVQEIVAEDGENLERLVHEVPAGRLLGYMPNALARSVQEACQQARPDMRPMLVLASGYAGVQRYGTLKPAHPPLDWAELPRFITRLLSLNISAAPLLCVDIPLANGKDEELTSRLLHALAFVPVIRLRLAADLDYAKLMHSGRLQEALERVFGLREAWLPYLYQLLWKAHTQGSPVLYPAAFFFPRWQPALGVQTQYLVGPHVLVCPAVGPGDTQETELPPGSWAHVATGRIIKGGQKTVLELKDDPLPMFFREGAIVPHFDNRNKDLRRSVIVTFFPFDDGVSEADIYDDDGETTRYRAGEYSSIHVRVTGTRKGYVVKFARREGKMNPSWSTYLLCFLRSRLDVQKIIYNRRELEYFTSMEELLKRRLGFYLDEERETLYVRIPYEREGGVVRF